MLSILLLTFFSILHGPGNNLHLFVLCDSVGDYFTGLSYLFIVSCALGSVYMDGIRFCIDICSFI